MATSGSYNFAMTRNEIIKDALIMLGIIGIEQTVLAPDQTYAERTLNRMIKEWQATGAKLWNRREGILFPADEQIKYTVGATDHVTTTADAAYTTLDAAEAASQTILSVTSTTGFANSDNIGIELDDGTRQWTTISSFVADDTVTVATALTGAAASGNTVYVYTNKINRPIEITEARRVADITGSTPTETPIQILRHEDYFSLSSKNTEGKINSLYYDKTLSNGTIYVWPEPDNVDDVIKFTYYDAIEDFDASTDNPDFPQEWLHALVVGLAARLAPTYGRYNELSVLKALADESFKTVHTWDSDIGSFQFGLDRR